MARYFFDVHDLCLSIHDHEGVECRDRDSVSAEAMKALCEIAEDQPDRYDGRALNIVVRDDANRAVLTATLNLSTSWHSSESRENAA
jgi:hypothetical protein